MFGKILGISLLCVLLASCSDSQADKEEVRIGDSSSKQIVKTVLKNGERDRANFSEGWGMLNDASEAIYQKTRKDGKKIQEGDGCLDTVFSGASELKKYQDLRQAEKTAYQLFDCPGFVYRSLGGKEYWESVYVIGMKVTSKELANFDASKWKSASLEDFKRDRYRKGGIESKNPNDWMYFVLSE